MLRCYWEGTTISSSEGAAPGLQFKCLGLALNQGSRGLQRSPSPLSEVRLFTAGCPVSSPLSRFQNPR